MVDKVVLQKKLDALPYYARIFIRKGFAMIGITSSILLTLFETPGTIILWIHIWIIAFLTVHVLITLLLLYLKLDLRIDEDRGWKKYRRSLYVELVLSVLLIILMGW